jgi:hypothetical protein
MESTVKCSCKEKHQNHICELFRTGQIEILELCTDDPFYTCLSCGVEANYQDCLCTPDPRVY